MGQEDGPASAVNHLILHFFIGVTKWLDSRALTGKNHWKLRWCGVAMAEKLSVRP